MKQERKFFQMNHENQTVVTSRSAQDKDLLEKVEKLLMGSTSDLKVTLLQDMMRTVLKLHDSDVDLLDIKILTRALKELRYGFTVFHPYQHVRKVSIYGPHERHKMIPIFNWLTVSAAC